MKLQPVGRIVHAVVVVADVASPIQNSDYVAGRQLKMMNVSRVSIYVYAAHGQGKYTTTIADSHSESESEYEYEYESDEDDDGDSVAMSDTL